MKTLIKTVHSPFRYQNIIKDKYMDLFHEFMVTATEKEADDNSYTDSIRVQSLMFGSTAPS